MRSPDDLARIADRLTAIKDAIDDLAAEAAALLAGAGPIRDRARVWLAALDRATGAEPQTTIDDTIEEFRAEAIVAAALPRPPLEATR
jgi:hypothetical protein